MDIHSVVCSQYLAALAMLRQAVERCPDPLWDAAQDENKFWRVAYHALFYTHLYLQESLSDFRPWAKHWQKAEELGRNARSGQPYSQAEVLEYLDFCREQAVEKTGGLNPEAPSGFHWCEFNKLELQFYNIRHVQQHTGELMERLGSRAGVSVDWISKGA